MLLAQDGCWGVVFLGSIFENHLLPGRSEDASPTLGWHVFVARVWRKGHCRAVLWMRSCLRGAVLACLARKRPGASSWEGTSPFLRAGLSTGCQKTTEDCEICFLGKELTPGARNTALLPSLSWLGPITCLSELAAVQQCLCQSLLLPPVLSGLQGKTVLSSSLGSLSLLWEVSLVSGCSECGMEINRVWKTTELLGGDGTPLLNIMCDWSPTELPAFLLSVCGARSQRTGWGWIHSDRHLAEAGAAPEMDMVHSVISTFNNK